MYLFSEELWMSAAVLDGCAYLALVGVACIGPLRRRYAFAAWPTAVLAMAFTYVRHAMLLCETAYAPLGPPNRIDSLMLVNLDPFAIAALVSIAATFRICQRLVSSAALLYPDDAQRFAFPIAAAFSYKTLVTTCDIMGPAQIGYVLALCLACIGVAWLYLRVAAREQNATPHWIALTPTLLSTVLFGASLEVEWLEHTLAAYGFGAADILACVATLTLVFHSHNLEKPHERLLAVILCGIIPACLLAGFGYTLHAIFVLFGAATVVILEAQKLPMFALGAGLAIAVYMLMAADCTPLLKDEFDSIIAWDANAFEAIWGDYTNLGLRHQHWSRTGFLVEANGLAYVVATYLALFRYAFGSRRTFGTSGLAAGWLAAIGILGLAIAPSSGTTVSAALPLALWDHGGIWMLAGCLTLVASSHVAPPQHAAMALPASEKEAVPSFSVGGWLAATMLLLAFLGEGWLAWNASENHDDLAGFPAQTYTNNKGEKAEYVLVDVGMPNGRAYQPRAVVAVRDAQAAFICCDSDFISQVEETYGLEPGSTYGRIYDSRILRGYNPDYHISAYRRAVPYRYELGGWL